MVLKDASGLVKQYAAVNVAQYNIVATADTQAECINRYNELLGKGALVDDSGQEKEESAPQETLTPVTVTIAKIEYVTVDGDTWVYILGTDQQILQDTVRQRGKRTDHAAAMWGTPCRFP